MDSISTNPFIKEHNIESNDLKNVQLNEKAEKIENAIATLTPFKIPTKPMDIIYINVSGKIFTTTFGTLTKNNNFFAAFFRNLNSMDAPLDKNGNLFIDRPSKPFKVLLAYLQTGCLSHRSKLINNEANFYLISLPETTKSKIANEKKAIVSNACEKLNKALNEIKISNSNVYVYYNMHITSYIIPVPTILRGHKDIEDLLAKLEDVLPDVAKKNKNLKSYNKCILQKFPSSVPKNDLKIHYDRCKLNFSLRIKDSEL